MFGKALLIALGAFICSYTLRTKGDEVPTSILILAGIIAVIFLLFIVGIFI